MVGLHGYSYNVACRITKCGTSSTRCTNHRFVILSLDLVVQAFKMDKLCQIPPFNDQANVQAVSSDIAVLLTDWLEDVRRPQSLASRGEFPVYRIDQAVDQYLAELGPGQTETKNTYEAVKRQLRRNW